MVKVIEGDLFETDAKYIGHQVNAQCVMGSGVARAVKDKYPNVYQAYKAFCKGHERLLGRVLSVTCPDGKVVLNLFAQDKFGYDGKLYTSYDALLDCFEQIKAEVPVDEVIAFPYLMGCHRGGGDWNKVYEMLEDVFTEHTVILYRKDMG